MTRIISGFAGSLPLQVPRSGTRPTSDRVREAIFSALEARDAIDGARVLDLYAGSGALGLEAYSRGSGRVVLVERGAPAAQVAKRNAATVRRSAPAPAAAVDVVVQSVQSYLDGRERAYDEVDLVFIDPPYELDGAEVAANLAALVPLLSEDAVVVVERSARTVEPAWPEGLVLERRKDYGETTLWWLAPGTA